MRKTIGASKTGLYTSVVQLPIQYASDSWFHDAQQHNSTSRTPANTPVYFLRLPLPPSSSMLAFTNRDLISARSETAVTFALVLVADAKDHN